MYLSGSCCFNIIIGSVCLNKDRAAPSSRNSISSKTICSYKFNSFLSGNLRLCVTFKTVSQWPFVISWTKPSTLSTVFKETPVSSCSVCKVLYKFDSLRYCWIRRITLKELRIWTPGLIFTTFEIFKQKRTYSADSISIDIFTVWLFYLMNNINIICL